MAVAKVVEISAASKTSFEDAIIQGLKRADDTIDNIEGAWIQEQKVTVKNGKIDEYRINMRVTFILKYSLDIGRLDHQQPGALGNLGAGFHRDVFHHAVSLRQ